MGLFLGIAKGLKRMHQSRGSRKPGRIQGRRRNGAEEDEDEAGERLMGDQNGDGEIRAYAHRDIKPGMYPFKPFFSLGSSNMEAGNIMIADDGTTPIVMDLGSLSPSPQAITSRSLALSVQDTAAEHSTMPYRAPELFDVKTGSIIDTKVDIWSLGCTLYACLVGKSPFEARSEETGGSLSICVLGGDWRFPDEKNTSGNSASTANGAQAKSQSNGNAGKGEEYVISEPVKDIVRRCLSVESAERPDVDELIQLIEDAIPGLEDF